MGISKKGKRKLKHLGEQFYWWVSDDFEGFTGHSIVVTVVSEDKKFLVKYSIDQRDNYFVTVLGSRFESGLQTGGVFKRFRSPKLGETNTFTPKDVVALIDWSLDKSAEKIEVDYKSQIIKNA